MELTGQRVAAPSKTPALPPAALTTAELKNGLQVLVQSDYAAPVVSIQFWCATGSIHENKLIGSGISHFLEHLLFKGTPTRGNSAMAQEIQALGGHLNAYTSFDRTVYHVDLPSDHWIPALDILADAMLHSTIPAEEFEKEREVIRREFAMGEDNPDRQLGHLLFRTAFTRHPYRFPVIGHLDLFNQITRDDVVAYYRGRYVPQNMTLVVCGAVDGPSVVTEARRLLEHVPRAMLPEVWTAPEPRQLGPRYSEIEFPTQLTRTAMVFHIPGVDHDDIPALDILATIMGGGRSARLHQICVEKSGLAEEIDAFAFSPAGVGLWGVDARCQPEQTEALEARILIELERICTEAPEPAEVDRARRLSLLQQVNGLKTMSGQAASLGRGWLLARDPDFSRRMLEKLQAVTPEDVKRVAAIYLRPEIATRVRVLPKRADSTPAVPLQGARELPVPSLLPISPAVQLVHLASSRLPLVSFRAIFRGGPLTEPTGRSGLARLAAKLLVKGTRHRTAEVLARDIEQLGGVVGADSANNSGSLNVEMLNQDWSGGLDLFLEILTENQFEDGELLTEKRKQLSLLKAEQDQPMAICRSLVRGAMYPDHPYRHSLLGTPDDLDAITTQDVRNYLKESIRGTGLILSVAGSLPDASWHGRIAERLQAAGIAPPQPSVPLIYSNPLTGIKRVEHIHEKEQAILQIAFPTVPMSHPDKVALEMLDEALSDLGSRLFIRIREELGLAYFVGTSQFSGLSAGHFLFYVGTDPKKRHLVEEALLKEINLIAQTGITLPELERARAKLVSEEKLEAQNPAYVAYSAALDEFYGLGTDFPKRRMRELETITLDKVNGIAQNYFNTKACILAIVSPS